MPVNIEKLRSILTDFSDLSDNDLDGDKKLSNGDVVFGEKLRGDTTNILTALRKMEILPETIYNSYASELEYNTAWTLPYNRFKEDIGTYLKMASAAEIKIKLSADVEAYLAQHNLSLRQEILQERDPLYNLVSYSSDVKIRDYTGKTIVTWSNAKRSSNSGAVEIELIKPDDQGLDGVFVRVHQEDGKVEYGFLTEKAYIRQINPEQFSLATNGNAQDDAHLNATPPAIKFENLRDEDRLKALGFTFTDEGLKSPSKFLPFGIIQGGLFVNPKRIRVFFGEGEKCVMLWEYPQGKPYIIQLDTDGFVKQSYSMPNLTRALGRENIVLENDQTEVDSKPGEITNGSFSGSMPALALALQEIERNLGDVKWKDSESINPIRQKGGLQYASAAVEVGEDGNIKIQTETNFRGVWEITGEEMEGISFSTDQGYKIVDAAYVRQVPVYNFMPDITAHNRRKYDVSFVIALKTTDGLQVLLTPYPGDIPQTAKGLDELAHSILLKMSSHQAQLTDAVFPQVSLNLSGRLNEMVGRHGDSKKGEFVITDATYHNQLKLNENGMSSGTAIPEDHQEFPHAGFQNSVEIEGPFLVIITDPEGDPIFVTRVTENDLGNP